MRIGSLFSGIGGLELGLERAGLGRTVWQVEKSEFCRSVLAKHWPDAERFEDVREVGAKNLGHVDLICGGFPCQDISSAGKGLGLFGDRSGLWFEFARIVGETKPAWVVVENVASGAKRWVSAVSSALGSLGYQTIPMPISAEAVGAGHKRARVFIIARSLERSNPERLELREQPWGCCRKGGKGASLLAISRETKRWPSGFKVVSPIHGVSADVVRALGNAVVPQCAEVVGWVIRELQEGTQ